VIRPLFGHDEAVARWVGKKVGIEHMAPCTAIGFVKDEGEIIAGVVFNNWRPPGIEATIASTSPRWCNRATLGVIFGYVFNQVKCRRLTATTEAKNQPVRAFLCHLGFREEGVVRQGFPNDDAVIYGMLREECRWLPKEETGNGCSA
jgi:RimJ/RimL family protein N-acetyltransferase